MISTQTVNLGEIKSNLFREIREYIDEDNSFYMRCGDTTEQVKYIANNELGNNLRIKKVNEAAVKVIETFLKPQEAILEGKSVYYSRFDDEKGDFIEGEGKISFIKGEEEETFTLDDPQASEYIGSPAFIYDEAQRIARFIGVIMPGNKVITPDALKNNQNENSVSEDEELGDERGAKSRVAVISGEYKGVEEGRGKGPRSIIINGPKIPQGGLHYKLTFISGKNKTNPHDDAKYNKNQEKLYEAALNQFVVSSSTDIPPNFIFDFFGTEYTADRE